MDIKKKGKNFRDIKESIVQRPNCENIPSNCLGDLALNLQQAFGEKPSFRKLSTLRNEPECFISPPKALTISTNPIENFDFSSTKKKLLVANGTRLTGIGKVELKKNDSTYSNKSEASNEKKEQFARFAKLAECSKEKDIRENLGLTFHRIASQPEPTNQRIKFQLKEFRGTPQTTAHRNIEPKRINFDELVIKPKTPTALTAPAAVSTSKQPILEQRKESIQSDYDQVNLSQSVEESLDMSPFI